MTYTTPELVLIITTIGTVISTAIVNIIVALKANQKMDKNLEKSTIIETHVNGEKSRFVSEIEKHRSEIERLKSIIAEKDKAAALVVKAVDAVQIVKELKIQNGN